MAKVTEHTATTYDLTGLTRDEMRVIMALVGQCLPDEVPAIDTVWAAIEDALPMSSLPTVLPKRWDGGWDAELTDDALTLDWN